MTTLNAKIDHSRSGRFGGVKHLHAVAKQHGIVELDVGDVISLSIVCDEEGCFLYRFNDLGDCVADTWHLTADQAILQAEFEYAVAPGEWERGG